MFRFFGGNFCSLTRLATENFSSRNVHRALITALNNNPVPLNTIFNRSKSSITSHGKLVTIMATPSQNQSKADFVQELENEVNKIFTENPEHLAIITSPTREYLNKSTPQEKKVASGHIWMCGVDANGQYFSELSKRGNPSKTLYRADIIEEDKWPVAKRIPVMKTRFTSHANEIASHAGFIYDHPAEHFQFNPMPLTIALAPFNNLDLTCEKFAEIVKNLKSLDENGIYAMVSVQNPHHSDQIVEYNNCISLVCEFFDYVYKTNLRQQLGHNPSTQLAKYKTSAVIFDQISMLKALMASNLISEGDEVVRPTPSLF